MDQNGTDRDALLTDLKTHLHENCVDFGRTEGDTSTEYLLDPEQMENIAVCDEKLLEKYLETGSVDDAEIRELIVQRKLFPCYFGSCTESGRRGGFLEWYTEIYVRAAKTGRVWGKSIQDRT